MSVNEKRLNCNYLVRQLKFRRLVMLKHILLGSSLLLMFLLSACGGGGNGGEGNTASSSSTTETYSKATLKVALVGTLPAGSAIGGVSFALFVLQPDLTLAMTNGSVDAGVVALSGTFVNGIQTEPIFTPNSTVPNFGKILMNVADTTQAGVTQVGEVARITLQLTNHKAPPAGSYYLAPYGVVDLSGNPIPTLQAAVTEVLLQ